jgi:hypothetical protein
MERCNARTMEMRQALLRADTLLDTTSTLDGNGTLSNPQSGRCVDSPSGSTANGTRLQIYDCNGSGAQAFAKA